MKRLGLLICLLSALLVLSFCKVCLSEDAEYAKIVAKYEGNPCVIFTFENRVEIYIFDKEVSEPIALEVRSADNSHCIVFYEKIDGEFKVVWEMKPAVKTPKHNV
jgi:hypothetical protein